MCVGVSWICRGMMYAAVAGTSLLNPDSNVLAQQVPASIVNRYASTADPSVSDEFNSPSLDTNKWAYRTLWPGSLWGTGPQYVQMLQDGSDQYVSIRGDWSERKGSGIATKVETHFGFFSVRWRTDNIVVGSPTPWHPAIWMAAHNVASGSDWRSIPPTDYNLEIDFVEYWHQPLWHSQAIAWDHSGSQTTTEAFKLRDPNDDFATTQTGWQEHGLEYHPDYLQLWTKQNGVWVAIGNRIPISDDPNQTGAIYRDFATPGYWILSNKEHFDVVASSPAWENTDDYSAFRFEDSSLDIDFFRYFPYLEPIAGDLNGDGFVGVADLNYVLGYWNRTTPPALPLADPSGDGYVGIEDLNLVLSNWNAGSASGLPEPASLMSLIAVLPMLAMRNRF